MLTINIKCLKHPRYNPHKHGEGGIVGSCAGCLEVLSLYQNALNTQYVVGKVKVIVK